MFLFAESLLILNKNCIIINKDLSISIFNLNENIC